MKLNQSERLDRILKAAVVVNWKDLMRGAASGLIHIEYGFASGGSLEYLKVWSSITRGHWLLVCEFWMSASTSHRTGIHFDNGYQSADLAQVLESVMQHQPAFSIPENSGWPALLQISTPTQEEVVAAATTVSEALAQFDSVFEQLMVA